MSAHTATSYNTFRMLRHALLVHRLRVQRRSTLAHDFLHRLPENLTAFRQVLLGDIQCRNEPDDLIYACGEDEHALLLAALRDAAGKALRNGWVGEGVVGACTDRRRKLGGDHEALTAHIEDARCNLGVIAQAIQGCEQFLGAVNRIVRPERR